MRLYVNTGVFRYLHSFHSRAISLRDWSIDGDGPISAWLTFSVGFHSVGF